MDMTGLLDIALIVPETMPTCLLSYISNDAFRLKLVKFLSSKNRETSETKRNFLLAKH